MIYRGSLKEADIIYEHVLYSPVCLDKRTLPFESRFCRWRYFCRSFVIETFQSVEFFFFFYFYYFTNWRSNYLVLNKAGVEKHPFGDNINLNTFPLSRLFYVPFRPSRLLWSILQGAAGYIHCWRRKPLVTQSWNKTPDRFLSRLLSLSNTRTTVTREQKQQTRHYKNTHHVHFPRSSNIAFKSLNHILKSLKSHLKILKSHL